MELVNFNEEQILRNGAIIYEQRDHIEAVADALCDAGFDLLLFTSSGGSQAMLAPFAFYIRHMSRLPVETVLSADLMLGDCNRITNAPWPFLPPNREIPPKHWRQPLAERPGRAFGVGGGKSQQPAGAVV